jgi:hypothetical protein
VGEIGIPIHDYYYELKWWELQAIERGYNLRHKEQWSAIRWMTFNIMAVMPYVDLKKACIRNPSDLIHFPWDNIYTDETGTANLPSDEEIKRMQQLMREENAKREKGTS